MPTRRSRVDCAPAEDLGFAQVDHDRARRCGFAEVVYAAGKTPAQTVAIMRALRRRGGAALATRTPDATVRALRKAFGRIRHDPAARTVIVGTPSRPAADSPFALVVAAGTSDLPVAAEARESLVAMGCRVELLTDVGVAGLHRLLARTPRLREAAVVIVCAGMEGALPSVIGGLVRAPVVAVPTSVGYGSSFGGLAALLGMLNSCASGVTVVNIDNGFGAAAAAARILHGRGAAD